MKAFVKSIFSQFHSHVVFMIICFEEVTDAVNYALNRTNRVTVLFSAIRLTPQMYFEATEAAVPDRKMLATDVNDSRQFWATSETEQLKTSRNCSKRNEERPGVLPAANDPNFLTYSVVAFNVVFIGKSCLDVTIFPVECFSINWSNYSHFFLHSQELKALCGLADVAFLSHLDNVIYTAYLNIFHSFQWCLISLAIQLRFAFGPQPTNVSI